MPMLHDIHARTLDGEEPSPGDLRGRVALGVDVASRFAPQTDPAAPERVAAVEKALA